jgi:PPOX class probable F420-dependent enzyme
MSSRDRVQMSEDEVAAFLADHLKVQVASIGREGAPHLTTLFYVLLDGRIAFWTYGRSQKIRNLERDPRVSALVEDGTAYAELRGVSISGRAELVRDPDRVREIGLAVAVRMVGARTADDLGELGRDVVEQQVPKRVGVLVHPDQVASWDHSKM